MVKAWVTVAENGEFTDFCSGIQPTQEHFELEVPDYVAKNNAAYIYVDGEFLDNPNWDMRQKEMENAGKSVISKDDLALAIAELSELIAGGGLI